MTNEEMQNTIQFILEQQAQLTVRVDRLTKNVDKLAEAQLSYQSRASHLEETFRLLVQLAKKYGCA